MKQLLVVSLGAERFWRLAFHERRGMSSLDWSDVRTVEVRGVVRKDGVGGQARARKLARVVVELTREDSQLSLRVAWAVVNLLESKYRILDAIVPQWSEDGSECVGEHDLICERKSQLAGDF